MHGWSVHLNKSDQVGWYVFCNMRSSCLSYKSIHIILLFTVQTILKHISVALLDIAIRQAYIPCHIIN